MLLEVNLLIAVRGDAFGSYAAARAPHRPGTPNAAGAPDAPYSGDGVGTPDGTIGRIIRLSPRCLGSPNNLIAAENRRTPHGFSTQTERAPQTERSAHTEDGS